MQAREPVRRFMTEAVLSVDLSSPAGEILRLFAAYPIHHLPVVDKTKVVGMLSSADVLKLEAFLPKHGMNRLQYLSEHLSIDTVMRRPPITIRAHEPLEQAASLMAKHGIHALPVTDAGDNLIGIITTTDIMHAALYPERRGDEHVAGESALPSRTPRLSPTQTSHALSLAAEMTGRDDDGGTIARALLHAHARLQPLESLLMAAERYVRAGQDERLHAVLLKAIDRARDDGGAQAGEPVL